MLLTEAEVIDLLRQSGVAVTFASWNLAVQRNGYRPVVQRSRPASNGRPGPTVVHYRLEDVERYAASRQARASGVTDVTD